MDVSAFTAPDGVSAMTDEYPPADDQHVPDCDDFAFSGVCICRQVARVEHRVMNAAVQQMDALWSLDPSWDGTNWNNSLTSVLDTMTQGNPFDAAHIAYLQGQRDALAGAVQRVEALEDDHDSGVDWDWDYDLDPSGMTRGAFVWIRVAVNAIKGDTE